MSLRDKLLRKIFGAPQSYIAALLDPRLGWDVRDDYATYLSEYDEPEAEEALFRVASNPDESEDMAESCGEAVAEIWCRKGTLKIDALRKLRRAALVEAVGLIGARRPEWLPLLRGEGLAGDEK
ncbi:MAG TPA: hypothetical protein VD861_18590 [Pyrinomonadaceae bacterium]|nr:hypothetical protein [Pyrinomonadaceae bacterium]